MISSLSSNSGCGCIQDMQPGRSGSSGRIAENLFAQMDGNSDGVVDKVELSNTLQGMVGNGASMPAASELFSRFDANNDGKITSEENTAAVKGLLEGYGHLSKAGGKHHQHHLEKLFDEADANGDGSVDKAELTGALASSPQGDGKAANVDKLFAQFDGDGDGVISKDERRAGFEVQHRMEQSTGTESSPSLQSFVDALLAKYQQGKTDSFSPQVTGSGFSIVT